MKAPLPDDEAQRIAALLQYKILDTPSEAAFDDVNSPQNRWKHYES